MSNARLPVSKFLSKIISSCEDFASVQCDWYDFIKSQGKFSAVKVVKALL